MGAVLLATMLAVSLAGCSTSETSSGVAATVGGVDIMEADVTARIETFMIDQSTGEKMDDVAWAQLLAGAGFTPESLREDVIREEFAMSLLVLQEAAEVGIEPDVATIDEQIEPQKASLGEGDEGAAAWANYLKQNGFSSEDSYRRYLEAQSVVTALLTAKVPASEPTAEEVEQYVSANAGFYAGKRSSAILFTIADEAAADEARARAEEALTRVEAGEDFGALAGEYSDDVATKENGGDMNWSAFAAVSQEYLEALDGLSVGQTSGLVETEGGIYIIKCTDEFVANDDGTVDFAAVPEDIVTMLTESVAQSNQAAEQQAYFDGLRTSDKLVINPMPEGLPYDVDMTLAEQAVDPAATDEPTDGEASGDTPASTGEMVIVDTQVGTGEEAKVGDTVSVHYIGYLEDGTIFESSYDSGTPHQFTLGTGGVIAGWEQGIPGMLVGGKRQLVIPPNMAYGETGSGPIPPNATLTFDVELVSID
jgi:foldase protein PrsA